MKNQLIVVAFLAFTFQATAQIKNSIYSDGFHLKHFDFDYLFPEVSKDPKQLLISAYNKCETIRNGYFEATKYLKFFGGGDTIKSGFNCSFKKLDNDSIFSAAFHLKNFDNGFLSGEAIYNNNEYIGVNPFDSTAEIRSNILWAKDIKSFSPFMKFYFPLIYSKSYNLLHELIFKADNHSFKFIGEEFLNHVSTYHIKINEILKNEINTDIKLLRKEYHFWIAKKDFIPVQYTIAYDEEMNHDSMYQYEKFILDKYEFNRLNDDSIFNINSVPAFFTLKDYSPVEYKYPELIQKDTLAPNWELVSMKGEKVSLAALKGKLVLIDFFYKACYPCMQALPTLQALHEKYKANGLSVIGINPYDKKDEFFEKFLAKRGITYTVLLGAKDASNDYHVTAYPTMYLIDKNGKVIFTQIGYSKKVDKELEDAITKNL